MSTTRSVAAAVCLVWAVAACGGSDESEASGTTTTTEASADPDDDDTGATSDGDGGEQAGPPTGAVGEEVTMAECCALTVHGVTDPYPADQLGPLFQPGPDERALGVDVEVVVREGEPKRFNFANVTVRDDAGTFNSVDTVVGGGQLDNVVRPGTPLRTTLIFRVDNAATGLRFEYAPLSEPEPVAVVLLS
jgi:hypothetical protein